MNAEPGPRRAGDRPTHPNAQAIILLVLVTLVIVGLAVASTF